MNNKKSPQASNLKPQTSELYIVGPTASGKSSLAVDIALEYGGEIVCADSQTLRKQLDIGTAKPTKADRTKIKHHMIDLIGPFDQYSVAQFQAAARNVINDIASRNKLPIIVGGSGMYIDSLYFDYTINEHKTNYSKDELEQLSVTELQNIIRDNGWDLPENSQNPRHLVGLIMRGGRNYADREATGKQKLIVGLLPKDDDLKKLIQARVEQMFKSGFVEEVQGLIKRYGTLPARMDAIGYPIVESYLRGKINLQTAKVMFARGHWQYARKQKAWFKRNNDIRWFTEKNEAEEYIKNTLNKNK